MTPLLPVQPYDTHSRRVEKKEQVAVGVGSAAGVGATAQKMATRRGMTASNATLGKWLENLNKTVSKYNTGSGKVAQTLAKFSKYSEIFTKDLKSIMKNPIFAKPAAFFGGVLAFFVLVTGMTKTAKTGATAMEDIKNKAQDLGYVA
jgi:hypothetical protein